MSQHAQPDRWLHFLPPFYVEMRQWLAERKEASPSPREDSALRRMDLLLETIDTLAQFAADQEAILGSARQTLSEAALMLETLRGRRAWVPHLFVDDGSGRCAALLSDGKKCGAREHPGP